MAAFEQYISDKYLSALHSPLLSSYLPASSNERDRFELSAMSDSVTLLDFVSATPAPVTKVLVDFAPTIDVIKRLAVAASWKGPPSESFLFLFAWWSVCLYGGLFIRFCLLPALILAPVVWPRLPQRFQPKHIPHTTEEILSTSLSNLESIYALRPNYGLKDPLPADVSLQERLRLLGLISPIFITLTYVAPFRVLIAAAGSVILTYRAPWVITTRRIVSRSAYSRAAWRYVVSILSGNFTIPMPIRKATLMTMGVKEPLQQQQTTRKTHPFMFTVIENQRWWVGIDWTAALLPSERPSWCAPVGSMSPSTNQGTTGTSQPIYHALPPPATFPLPASTSIVLPASDGKGFVRKTAKWRWEDDSEWEVLVHKEGDDTVRKLRPPLKSPTEDDKGHLIAKAAGRLTTTPSPTVSSFPTQEGNAGGAKPTVPSPVAQVEKEFTDQDGWIYGDNKWENTSAKGGIGKFTRFRRWCRVAILEEEEESVDETEAKPNFTQLETRRTLSPEKDRRNTSKEEIVASPTSEVTTQIKQGSPKRNRGRSVDTKKTGSVGSSGGESLQQRLKAALKSNS
ncbi:hypothetical protein FRB91_000190 [Serendipita sp. 411]|nr:hypothetical protein FRC20_003593 [Serendipita sp. 405]KAG8847107.1 hypothetical protein FRB91_000190 [Serendipita sp. 411]